MLTRPGPIWIDLENVIPFEIHIGSLLGSLGVTWVVNLMMFSVLVAKGTQQRIEQRFKQYGKCTLEVNETIRIDRTQRLMPKMLIT